MPQTAQSRFPAAVRSTGVAAPIGSGLATTEPERTAVGLFTPTPFPTVVVLPAASVAVA